MELTPEDIEEFRSIWKDEFKEEISVDDARQRFRELIELYALLARVEKKPGDLSEKEGESNEEGLRGVGS